MAKIFPQSIKDFDFKQPGEERVFDILRSFPEEYRVWYEVVLGERSRRPDFLILDPKRGITIIEVKDWGRYTIMGASKREFKIKAKGDSITRRKNGALGGNKANSNLEAKLLTPLAPTP